MDSEDRIDKAYRNFRIHLAEHNRKIDLDPQYARQYRRKMRKLDLYIWKSEKLDILLILKEFLMNNRRKQK